VKLKKFKKLQNLVIIPYPYSPTLFLWKLTNSLTRYNLAINYIESLQFYKDVIIDVVSHNPSPIYLRLDVSMCFNTLEILDLVLSKFKQVLTIDLHVTESDESLPGKKDWKSLFVGVCKIPKLKNLEIDSIGDHKGVLKALSQGLVFLKDIESLRLVWRATNKGNAIIDGLLKNAGSMKKLQRLDVKVENWTALNFELIQNINNLDKLSNLKLLKICTNSFFNDQTFINFISTLRSLHQLESLGIIFSHCILTKNSFIALSEMIRQS